MAESSRGLFCIQGTWRQNLVLTPPRITHTRMPNVIHNSTLLLSVSSLATAVNLWFFISPVQGDKTGARLLFHPDCEMGIYPSPWRLDLHNPSVHGPPLFHFCSKHVKTAHSEERTEAYSSLITGCSPWELSLYFAIPSLAPGPTQAYPLVLACILFW
jgi:hypothetical protein